MERILGIVEGDEPGPLVICIAGIHGNEQLGLHAFRNVCSAIKNHEIPFKGKLIGIVGNIKAIQCNYRFLDYDLNRAWTQENIDNIKLKTILDEAEDEELLAIHSIVEEEAKGDYPMKIVVDLHATSAERGNFVIVPEGEENFQVIRSLHIPVVIEIVPYLKGTLVSYYQQLGYTAFAFEGGVISTKNAYQLHTSGLWEILDSAGCISHHDHENEDHYASQLREVSESLPDTVKALHCHKITSEDRFKMLPGFHNFQQVYKGQHLAMDRNGPVHAPMDGMIFMPLYQSQGDDGFFIVEELKQMTPID